MSKIMDDLQSVGIALDGCATPEPKLGAGLDELQSRLVFSGYADFTPITVTSGTRIKDAHMERDKL